MLASRRGASFTSPAPQSASTDAFVCYHGVRQEHNHSMEGH